MNDSLTQSTREEVDRVRTSQWRLTTRMKLFLVPTHWRRARGSR